VMIKLLYRICAAQGLEHSESRVSHLPDAADASGDDDTHHGRVSPMSGGAWHRACTHDSFAE
jgi:hypothetical protein